MSRSFYDPLDELKRLVGLPVRVVITTDGKVSQIERQPHAELLKLIKADTSDTVLLVDRVHVMLVDDKGHPRDLPVNQIATELYWQKCGGRVDHVIRGNVVVVPDSDFSPTTTERAP